MSEINSTWDLVTVPYCLGGIVIAVVTFIIVRGRSASRSRKNLERTMAEMDANRPAPEHPDEE